MNVLEIQNVSKEYDNKKALHSVSLEVKKGRIFGLLGPNGAGKTTLIRIINQITAPDEGAILFNGEKFKRKHIHNIGYLPEERGLYKSMKVGEQCLYLAQLKGLSKNDAKQKIHHWFKKLDNHNCEYCHISHDKYFKKKVYKKYPGIKTWLKFTLDRKDSSKPYTLKNISICCPLCNYVKGYIFSAKDFREIANQYIKPLYK